MCWRYPLVHSSDACRAGTRRSESFSSYPVIVPFLSDYDFLSGYVLTHTILYGLISPSASFIRSFTPIPLNLLAHIPSIRHCDSHLTVTF
jgi:hypothetical protein